MAVGFDAVSNPGASIGASPNPGTWTHTPVGTPRGVLVMLYTGVAGDPIITGVTYGGVAMSSEGFVSHPSGAGENGQGHAYFLGSGIPVGAQTVAVSHTGTSSGKWGVCVTVTASEDTEIVASDDLEAVSVANPSFTFDTGGRSALRMMGGMTGVDAAGSIAAQSGCTILGAQDAGTRGGVFVRGNAAAPGSASVGFTAGSDDVAIVGVAIAEAVPPPDPTPTGNRMGGTGAIRRSPTRR